VLFERLVWHLESPAGIVFPKVGGPTGLMRCHRSTLWDQFRAHVLKRCRNAYVSLTCLARGGWGGGGGGGGGFG
jgi:hypothetical protein